MKPIKTKCPSIFVVEWDDAYSNEGSNIGDGDGDFSMPTVTVGFLVWRNRKSIAVAANYMPEDGKYTKRTMVVPMAIVRKVYEVK